MLLRVKSVGFLARLAYATSRARRLPSRTIHLRSMPPIVHSIIFLLKETQTDEQATG